MRPVEGMTPAMAKVVPAVVAVSLTRAAAMVPVVAVRLLNQNRTDRIVATVVSRRLVRPVLPGRLTRPRAVRRGRAPGGVRSSDRPGRTSGSREHSAPFSIRMLRRFRPLVAKTTAPTFVATKWRVCPFCFLGWHHRNDSRTSRVASLGNSESGGLASNECSWNVWDKGGERLEHKKSSGWLARSK